jgi:hypothetical protein
MPAAAIAETEQVRRSFVDCSPIAMRDINTSPLVDLSGRYRLEAFRNRSDFATKTSITILLTILPIVITVGP